MERNCGTEKPILSQTKSKCMATYIEKLIKRYTQKDNSEILKFSQKK